MALLIHNLDFGCSCIVSFMPIPLYPLQRAPSQIRLLNSAARIVERQVQTPVKACYFVYVFVYVCVCVCLYCPAWVDYQRLANPQFDSCQIATKKFDKPGNEFPCIALDSSEKTDQVKGQTIKESWFDSPQSFLRPPQPPLQWVLGNFPSE